MRANNGTEAATAAAAGTANPLAAAGGLKGGMPQRAGHVAVTVATGGEESKAVAARGVVPPLQIGVPALKASSPSGAAADDSSVQGQATMDPAGLLPAVDAPSRAAAAVLAFGSTAATTPTASPAADGSGLTGLPARLTSPHTLPLRVLMDSHVPLADLQPHLHADANAYMLFLFANAVAVCVLQPWYVLVAAPLTFYYLDNYLDRLLTGSKRMYPSRLQNDFWTTGTRVVIVIAALLSVLIVSRNPLTSATLSAIRWDFSTFNGAEFALGVVGIAAMFLIVRQLIATVMDSNALGNGCCCGRRVRDFRAIRHYLAYVRQQLFERATRRLVMSEYSVLPRDVVWRQAAHLRNAIEATAPLVPLAPAPAAAVASAQPAAAGGVGGAGPAVPRPVRPLGGDGRPPASVTIGGGRS